MKISKNKVVSVNYHLAASKSGGPEELVEQTSVEQPFVFLCGSDAV
jgi:FKBP-type peptidyl-prolyl cis-trans isomerase 2